MSVKVKEIDVKKMKLYLLRDCKYKGDIEANTMLLDSIIQKALNESLYVNFLTHILAY